MTFFEALKESKNETPIKPIGITNYIKTNKAARITFEVETNNSFEIQTVTIPIADLYRNIWYLNISPYKQNKKI